MYELLTDLQKYSGVSMTRKGYFNTSLPEDAVQNYIHCFIKRAFEHPLNSNQNRIHLAPIEMGASIE